MAEINFPCRIPGVLVGSNSYVPKGRVRRNDLDSGPPLFIREDDDGYVTFPVAWSFNAIEMQVFRNFFRYNLASGSKLFNIDLWVDGFDGEKNTKTHECYFDQAAYSAAQNGKRWSVTATLIAINEAILNECDGESMVNFYEGIDYNVNLAVSDFLSVVQKLEDVWQP